MATSRHLGLGIVETRWFDERHHTVRPLFEFLSFALRDRSDAFIYERFVGAPSFRDAVRFIMSDGDIGFLYVAAHGDIGKIKAPDGTWLSRTFLRNTFVEVNRQRRRLKGVLFGSCKFGDEANLVELLRPAKIRGEEIDSRLIWAGGYGMEIDYTRSSLFDIAFFDIFFRTNGGDEIKRLERTIEQLDKAMPGVAKNLTLRVVARVRKGPLSRYHQRRFDRRLTLTRGRAMAAFKGFGAKALPFFKALKFHQSKAWFDENRELYDRDVVEPMIALLDDLTARFAKAKIPLKASGKKSMFRINRDVRFAKDKSPYKTHAGAVMTRSGGKMENGLVYIHIDPEGCFVAGGFHIPEPGGPFEAAQGDRQGRRQGIHGGRRCAEEGKVGPRRGEPDIPHPEGVRGAERRPARRRDPAQILHRRRAADGQGNREARSGGRDLRFHEAGEAAPRFRLGRARLTRRALHSPGWPARTAKPRRRLAGKALETEEIPCASTTTGMPI